MQERERSDDNDMAFFNKLKHAFGFNEQGDDLDDELDYDLANAPYVNPFHRERTAAGADTEHRKAHVEAADEQLHKQAPEQDKPHDAHAHVTPAATVQHHSAADAEHRVQVAQQRANMLAQRVADLENAMHKQEVELKQALDDANATHRREIKAMQEAISKAKAEADRINEVENTWRQRLETERAEKQSLKERNDQLIAERNAAEDATRQRIDEAKAQADSRANALAKQVEALKQELEDMETRQSSVAIKQRNTITDLNNRINDLKRQMATAATLADDYREQMNKMRREATAATDVHDDLRSEIEQYKQMLHTSQSAEMTALDEQQRLKKEADKAWRARNEAESKLEALQRDQADITQQLKDDYETRIDTLGTQLTQAEQELEQLRSKCTLNEQKLAQNEIKIQALEATDEAKTQQLKTLEDELAESEKQVEKLTKQSKKHSDIASQHVDTARRLETTRQELDRQIKLYVAAQGEINQLNNDLALAQAELQSLNHRLNEITTQPAPLQTQESPLPTQSGKDTIITFDDELPPTPEPKVAITVPEPESHPEPESQPEESPEPEPEPQSAPEPAPEQKIEPQPEKELAKEPAELIATEEPVREPVPVMHTPSLDDIDDINWLMPAEPDEIATIDEPDSHIAQEQADTDREPDNDPRQLSLF